MPNRRYEFTERKQIIIIRALEILIEEGYEEKEIIDLISEIRKEGGLDNSDEI